MVNPEGSRAAWGRPRGLERLGAGRADPLPHSPETRGSAAWLTHRGSRSGNASALESLALRNHQPAGFEPTTPWFVVAPAQGRLLEIKHLRRPPALKHSHTERQRAKRSRTWLHFGYSNLAPKRIAGFAILNVALDTKRLADQQTRKDARVPCVRGRPAHRLVRAGLTAKPSLLQWPRRDSMHVNLKYINCHRHQSAYRAVQR